MIQALEEMEGGAKKKKSKEVKSEQSQSEFSLSENSIDSPKEVSLNRYNNIYAAAGHPNCIFKIDFDNLKKITKGSVKNITEWHLQKL